MRCPPFDGRTLASRKVRMLCMVAGSFEDVQFSGRTLPKGHPEFNIMTDPASARRLLEDWPTPIVLSGIEVGSAMRLDWPVIQRRLGADKDHPLAAVSYTH